MKWLAKTTSTIMLALLYVTCCLVSVVPIANVEASTTSTVNTTVIISTCGNNLKEGGEDCDNASLGGETCMSLGYTSGTLHCDISCSMETSSCVVPSLNPSQIPSENVSSLLAAGYLSIPATESILTPSSLTATSQLTITIPVVNGTSSIVLPKDVVITRSDGNTLDPTSINASNISTSSLAGFSNNPLIDGALQWGIPSATLAFSSPITLHISVGASLNGEVLNILRSENQTSGWTSDGIVTPATCTVAAGICSFQTTKASYFVTTRTSGSTLASSSSSNNTATGSSSNSSGSSSSPTQTAATATPIIKKIVTLPQTIQLFDLDKSGNIKVTELFAVLTKWVDAQNTKRETCDINSDSFCDVHDLSILLYYVER